MKRLLCLSASCLFAGLLVFGSAFSQEPVKKDEAAVSKGSIVEDRAAKKLLEAGDARYEADEVSKAVEIWQSVIERYPRSKVRYEAYMKLGNFYLQRDRQYDKARAQFEQVSGEENRNEEQRAEATLKAGICFYEARNFGKCFQVMRDVIEKFPVSKQVNEAYYYIGLGHFQLGHYSRAIQALEKVGTTLSSEEGKVEKLEAGKRLFVKIEDADLAAIEPGQSIKVECIGTSGDKELVECFSVGRNVRIALGSLLTKLGKPQPGNGTLELKGDDNVEVSYIDEQTADKQFNRKLLHKVTVVGNGLLSINDGAFKETLRGVVLGKTVNVQIIDADRDLTDAADTIQAVIEVVRPKTDEEIENEIITAKKDGKTVATDDDGEPKIERFKKVDKVAVTLTEAKVDTSLGKKPVDDEGAEETKVPAATTQNSTINTTAGAPPPKPDVKADPKAANAPESKSPAKPVIEDNSIHSGVFRVTLPLVKADEVVSTDDTLQALPGDLVRVSYVDQKNTGLEARTVTFDAKCIEGNLGGVRVTKAMISDRELRVQTQLKTAHALTNIGNRYKEFGLKKNADAKYEQALDLCEEIMAEAQKLGGKLLEETYVELWQIYYQMDKLELAAAMAERLQRDFPNSGFVDDALLQLADVALKQSNFNRAIGVYQRLVQMQTSQLRGEAQFGIAQCYDKMADQQPNEAGKAQLFDRAFQEYKKVFDNFPESGRVGEAVAQMANYYYRQKDYARAVDIFETVLENHPDAKFLDVILFNYGRCLYRMDRKAEARKRFDQLIGDYPESPLAGDAKKISEALNKADRTAAPKGN
ncbi:MAG: tetratricopeptide repeat protein [Planctomycetia bacterium]|nr:tetratricopeptide repeat protein [Planctomycetia bacterium]